jgi:hypothetical protein
MRRRGEVVCAPLSKEEQARLKKEKKDVVCRVR